MLSLVEASNPNRPTSPTPLTEHDKQSEKHHTLSPHTDDSRSISTKLCMMIQDVRDIIASPNFLDPIKSLATRDHRKLWIVYRLISRAKATKFGRLKTCINPENFVKNRARDMPLRGNYVGKFQISRFWGRKPTSLSRSRWNLAGKSGA